MRYRCQQGPQGIILEPHSTNQVAEYVERRSSPDAPMNLILRFETVSGPRTVIACAVPRQIAAEIADVMNAAGQYAEFVDRYSALSVADRILVRDIEQVPQQQTETVMRADWEAALASRFTAGRARPRRAANVA
jgi:hypothetical protein